MINILVRRRTMRISLHAMERNSHFRVREEFASRRGIWQVEDGHYTEDNGDSTFDEKYPRPAVIATN